MSEIDHQEFQDILDIEPEPMQQVPQQIPAAANHQIYRPRNYNPGSVKIPPFWIDNPLGWCTIAEGQFELFDVPDADKFHLAMARVDSETSKRCQDIIDLPRSDTKYESLKERLVKVFTLSHSERSTKLLHLPAVGDGRPSDRMADMLAIKGDMPYQKLFRTLFLEGLSDDINSALADEEFMDNKELAAAADRRWLRRRREDQQIRAVQKVSTPVENGHHNSATEVNQVRKDEALCFYHKRFREKANKCVPPCIHWKAFQASQGNSKAGRQ